MKLNKVFAALALVMPIAANAQGADNAQSFAQRFMAADTNKDGKLTREEAYTAFPRMPQYFDEIDVNRDGSITLVEIDAAKKKRIDAALAASKHASGRYALPATVPPATSATAASPAASSVLVGEDEAHVFHDRQYYDDLAGELSGERMRGEPTPRTPAPGQFQMSF